MGLFIASCTAKRGRVFTVLFHRVFFWGLHFAFGEAEKLVVKAV